MGIRISEMEEATTFGADDYVPIVTNGTNKKALGQKIKDFIAGFFATKTGDNISDKATFRSAIEISATNTPFDKTGTGMSAENVQAGIAELSGNRALIDGSNIVDASAFRQAIHVPAYNFANQDRPKMTLIIAQVTISISGGTGSTNLSSYLPSGMSFSSIALATAKSTTSFAVTGATIDTTTNILTIKVSNTSSSSTTDFNIMAFAF